MTPASCVRASERPTQLNLSLSLTFAQQRRLLQIRSQTPGQGLILEINYLAAAAARTQWAPGSTFALRLLATWCGHDRSECVYIPKRRIYRPLSLRRVCTQPAALNGRNISCQDKYGAGQKAACY
jgi:hypothetical protein